MKDSLPLVEELQPPFSAVSVFRRLCHLPHCLFLDSAAQQSPLGSYSFVAADPFRWFSLAVNQLDRFPDLEQQLRRFPANSVPELPPFQGGAAGLFGYELGRTFERLPATTYDEFQMPVLGVGLYDVVFAFDHRSDKAWVISHGFPEESAAQRQRAAERLRQARSWLEREPAGSTGPAQDEELAPRLTAEQLAPQFPVRDIEGLTSNFSQEGYLDAVERVIEYIHAGDIFQANLSQRLLFPAREDSVSLYLRLRQRNPAPFAGYLDTGTFQVVSASPERFLAAGKGAVEARPIKGTRQRLDRPEADLFAASDLLQSEKDRAENVMIVDLLRNDLSRVCRPETVRVSELCRLETYQYVQHLVSVVEGKLASGRHPLDLIAAAFPGGSITGAPKVRAMEIISELEPTARGAYCGALGYIGFDETTDLNILIRTITAGRGWWQLPVGGGIVAQSNPNEEYAETWHKAEGLLRSLMH